MECRRDRESFWTKIGRVFTEGTAILGTTGASGKCFCSGLQRRHQSSSPEMMTRSPTSPPPTAVGGAQLNAVKVQHRVGVEQKWQCQLALHAVIVTPSTFAHVVEKRSRSVQLNVSPLIVYIEYARAIRSQESEAW